MADQSPNQQTGPSATKGPIPDKYFAPVAVGLGILLIIGGIYLGVTNNQKVTQLPNYSPVFVSSPVTVAPTPAAALPSPTAQATSTPPSTRQEATSTKGGVVTPSRVKAVAKPKVGVQTPLPLYSPQAPLPLYSPGLPLPDYQPQFVSPSPSPVAPATVSVNLQVPGRTYTISVRNNATVLQVFEEATRVGLSYRSHDFQGLGKMIIEINNQAQGNGQWWTYTINGVFAQKGVSTQTVGPGDTISWTFS